MAKANDNKVGLTGYCLPQDRNLARQAWLTRHLSPVSAYHPNSNQEHLVAALHNIVRSSREAA